MTVKGNGVSAMALMMASLAIQASSEDLMGKMPSVIVGYRFV